MLSVERAPSTVYYLWQLRQQLEAAICASRLLKMSLKLL